MNSPMRELYQEMILEHYKNPRNYGEMPDADRNAEGFNPLCGDHICLHLKLRDGKVADAKFEGQGCAICTASASLMTQNIMGKEEDYCSKMFEKFRRLVTIEEDNPPGQDEIGKLAVFSGVREFPARVKCAILPWHALNAALEGTDEPVSTE